MSFITSEKKNTSFSYVSGNFLTKKLKLISLNWILNIFLNAASVLQPEVRRLSQKMTVCNFTGLKVICTEPLICFNKNNSTRCFTNHIYSWKNLSLQYLCTVFISLSVWYLSDDYPMYKLKLIFVKLESARIFVQNIQTLESLWYWRRILLFVKGIYRRREEIDRLFHDV